jgi:hypothetical protein
MRSRLAGPSRYPYRCLISQPLLLHSHLLGHHGRSRPSAEATYGACSACPCSARKWATYTQVRDVRNIQVRADNAHVRDVSTAGTGEWDETAVKQQNILSLGTNQKAPASPSLPTLQLLMGTPVHRRRPPPPAHLQARRSGAHTQEVHHCMQSPVVTVTFSCQPAPVPRWALLARCFLLRAPEDRPLPGSALVARRAFLRLRRRALLAAVSVPVSAPPPALVALSEEFSVVSRSRSAPGDMGTWVHTKCDSKCASQAQLVCPTRYSEPWQQGTSIHRDVGTWRVSRAITSSSSSTVPSGTSGRMPCTIGVLALVTPM